jgi:uncharacterized RDD family membrane protein YckC
MEQYDATGFSDQLNIATPEQVEIHFPIAGIGSRFVALLADTLLQFGAFLVIVLAVVWFLSGTHDSPASAALDTAGKWFIAAIIFLIFCVWWGYFTLFEAYWRGQTPGKRWMKLRVIKESGRQITFFESLTRNLLRTVDAMPSFYLIGLVSMACNRANKRLGDFAAGTIVVHELREEQPLFAGPATTLVAPTPMMLDPWAARVDGVRFPADAIAKLRPADLSTIENFFARALDLPLPARAELATRMARQLCAKMQVAVPEGNPERALESMAHAMRGAARF